MLNRVSGCLDSCPPGYIYSLFSFHIYMNLVWLLKHDDSILLSPHVHYFTSMYFIVGPGQNIVISQTFGWTTACVGGGQLPRWNMELIAERGWCEQLDNYEFCPCEFTRCGHVVGLFCPVRLGGGVLGLGFATVFRSVTILSCHVNRVDGVQKQFLPDIICFLVWLSNLRFTTQRFGRTHTAPWCRVYPSYSHTGVPSGRSILPQVCLDLPASFFGQLGNIYTDLVLCLLEAVRTHVVPGFTATVWTFIDTLNLA